MLAADLAEGAGVGDLDLTLDNIEDDPDDDEERDEEGDDDVSFLTTDPREKPLGSGDGSLGRSDLVDGAISLLEGAPHALWMLNNRTSSRLKSRNLRLYITKGKKLRPRELKLTLEPAQATK